MPRQSSQFRARQFQELFPLPTVVSLIKFPWFNRTKIYTNTIARFDLKYDYNIIYFIQYLNVIYVEIC